MYFFNYVDRGALAQARLNDFETDLGMTGNDFNVAVSILVVGYVLMQIPSNMLLTRVRPSIYLAACMIIWSTISGLHRPRPPESALPGGSMLLTKDIKHAPGW